MPLEAEFRRYEEMRVELERQFHGKYFVFCGSNHIGPYDTLAVACEQAAERWQSEPVLIRKIGVNELQELTDQVTPENRHGETNWGKPEGKEVW